MDVPHSLASSRGSRADDLIVVFTKNSLGRLEQTLPKMIRHDFSIVVLDDSSSSVTRDQMDAWPNVTYHGKNEQTEFLAAIDDTGLKDFVCPLGEEAWRLGQLRNYALLLGLKMGASSLLMIDDDIVIEDETLIASTLSLLEKFPIVGANTLGMPDFSVTGHIESSIGDAPLTFISGQYMAVDLKAVHWSFPNVYNEDWIFALLHAIRQPVGRHGVVWQLDYDVASGVVSRASFQEPGELICEGVAELLLEGLDECKLTSEDFWLDILKYRQDLLKNTFKRVPRRSWMATTLSALLRYYDHARLYDTLKTLSTYLAAQPKWRTGYMMLRERA